MAEDEHDDARCHEGDGERQEQEHEEHGRPPGSVGNAASLRPSGDPRTGVSSARFGVQARLGSEYHSARRPRNRMIDKLDASILSILQENARTSNAAIA